MKTHEKIRELLPFYISGQLAADEHAQVKEHLEQCAECQEELALWQDVSAVMKDPYKSLKAPSSVLSQALETIREKENRVKVFQRSWQMLQAQIPLVNKEIWPASLMILVLGFVVTLIADKTVFFYALAPLVSAGGLAFIYGGKQDPAYELTLSTPVSQVQILLARSVLVFGYNFILTVLLSLGLSFYYSFDLILPLVMEWLAPMTFLSSLGLCISIFSNSENAIIISYFLWLFKYLLLTPDLSDLLGQAGRVFLLFWGTTTVLYLVSGCLLIAMLVFVGSKSKITQELA